MTQYNSSQAARQRGDRRTRIRQPAFISKEPQYRQCASVVRTPCLDRARPSDKPHVHGIPYPI
jgi:hypothetical protein